MNHTYKQHQPKAYNPSYTLPRNTANLTRPERDKVDQGRYKRLYEETGDPFWLEAIKRLEPDWTPDRDFTLHWKTSNLINKITDSGWTQKEISEAIGPAGERTIICKLANGKFRGVSKERTKRIYQQLKTLER